jgi:GTP cyclohydrolase I
MYRSSIEANHPAVKHAAAMMAALGIEGDDRTALRHARALDEMAWARALAPVDRPDEDAAPPLATTFDVKLARPALVMVRDVEYASLCEHHLLPFSGIATLAYLPREGQQVVGLSKLARLIRQAAARPQIQERLTDQVVTAMQTGLNPAGVALAVRGVHSCMAHRGVRAAGAAAMVTAQYLGALNEHPWLGQFQAALQTPAWIS